MSLMRSRLAGTAYTDVSSAAYRKSGVVLGRVLERTNQSRQGRLKITQDVVLGGRFSPRH
jgi:hypothetical protein